LQLGSPGLSQFPDQTYTFNSLSPSISMVNPLSSSPGAFDYTSSNPNVGTVEAGTFAMKGVGSTVITATQRQSGPYGSASIQATYTVQAADSQLRFTTTGVSTVLIGRPFSLKTASNSPGNITYTSSNAAVDTVRIDQYTVQVTPQSAGDVHVIASQAGSPEYQGKLVTMPIQVRIEPELSLATFSTVTNAPAFQPPWTTKSNGAITVVLTPQTGINVASLSGNTITPTGVGTVLVTVTQAATTTYGGATVSALMTVGAKTPAITGLGTGYSLVYPAVSSFTLPRPSSPSTAPFIYESSNTSVATIATDANGAATVTLRGAGLTELIVRQEQEPSPGTWGSARASVSLTVSAGSEVPSAALANMEKPFGAADFKLNAQVNGVAGNITAYTSSNPNVAEVLADGFTVHIKDVGNTTLTAVQNGNKVATGTLTVVKGEQVIDFSDRSLQLTSTDPFVMLQATATSLEPVRFVVASGNTERVYLGADGHKLWLLWQAFSRPTTFVVKITATQDGNAHYKPASVTKTFTVDQAGNVLPWISVTQPVSGSATTNDVAVAKVRHNMVASMPITFPTVFVPESADRAWERCKPINAVSAPSPESDMVVTVQLAGDQGGTCKFYIAPYDNAPTSTLLGSVSYAPSWSAQPSAVVWPPIVLVYGQPGTAFTTPVAIPPQDLLVDNPAIAELNDWTQSPRLIIPRKVGTTMMGSQAAVTTVQVLPAPPTITGWSEAIAANLTQGSLTFNPPISNSAGAFSYTVTPADIATVNGNGLILQKSGQALLTVRQAANGNYAESSASRTLWVGAGALTLDFGTVDRTFGDADFELRLPAQIQTDKAYTVTSSAPAVVTAAPGQPGTVKVSIVGAGTATLTVTQTAAQSGGTSDVTATATVNVAKAWPNLSYTFLSTAVFTQPECWNQPSMTFPRLDGGASSLPNARLTSLSGGTVLYRSQSGLIATPNNGDGYGGTLQGTSWSWRVQQPGELVNFVIEQMETPNYRSQTIQVPGAVQVLPNAIFTCAV
jgi:hypothetical protein